MKKLIVFILAGAAMTLAVQAGAFDIAVGGRYFTGYYPGMRDNNSSGTWHQTRSH